MRKAMRTMVRGTDEIYISIPDDTWNDFANDFSIQVYNNKADYKKRSLMFSTLLALLGGVVTYFISRTCTETAQRIFR